MATLMQHPQHGRHLANGDEISRLQGAGWSVCPILVQEPSPPSGSVAASVPAESLPPVVEHPQDEKPRLGRSPKNKVGNDRGHSADTD